MTETTKPRIRKSRDNVTSRLLITLLLFSSILPLTTLGNMHGYIITLMVYIGVVLYCFYQTGYTLEVRSRILLFIGLLWLPYFLRSFFPVTPQAALYSIKRIPIFTIIFILNLFLIPTAIKLKSFLYSLSTLGFCLTLAAIPTLFGVTLEIGTLEIKTHEPLLYTIPIVDKSIPVLTGVFIDSNLFGTFLMMAVLASIAITDLVNVKVGSILLAVNTTGLYMTHSRAAIAATCCGIIIYITYILFNKEIFYGITIILFMSGVIFSLFVFNILPSPGYIPQLNLTGRLEIWRASLEAFKNYPIIGHGAGYTTPAIEPYLPPRLSGMAIHNSYIRIFVTAGLVGGLTYIAMVIYMCLTQYVSLKTRLDVIVLSMMVASAINQIFLSLTLLGISSTSIIASVIYGYGINRSSSSSE